RTQLRSPVDPPRKCPSVKESPAGQPPSRRTPRISRAAEIETGPVEFYHSNRERRDALVFAANRARQTAVATRAAPFSATGRILVRWRKRRTFSNAVPVQDCWSRRVRHRYERAAANGFQRSSYFLLPIERALQLPSRTGEPRHDRADRHRGDFGDFLVRKPFQLAQHERFAKLPVAALPARRVTRPHRRCETNRPWDFDPQFP